MHRSGPKRPAKGRRTKTPAARKASGAHSPLVDPQNQLVERLKRERDEAVKLQAASAEVLKIISSSPRDMKPVFEAMLGNALHICDAKFGHMLLYDGERFHAKHLHDVPPSYRAFWDQHGPIRPNPKISLGRLARTKQVVHIPDLKAEPAYTDRDPLRVVTVEQAGARSFLAVPMLKKNELIGAIVIYRQEVRPFAENQIALVATFADQAVIAIENARLFNETKEALERQTATSDVLKVIASSPSDVQPVFDAIVNSAAKLFEPCSATITTLKDGKLHWNAIASLLPGFDPEGAKAIYPIPFDPERSPSARAMLKRQIIEIPDIAAPDTPEFTRKAGAAGGFRSCTFVPLVHQDTSIGTIILIHPQAGFRLSERQLALVQTFADQAVIAIQNARLFDEVQAKTRELTEALTYQTGSANILKVIASSPTDVEPVLRAIVESACVICEAEETHVALRDGDELVFRVQHGSAPVVWKRQPINRLWVTGRAAVDRRPVHVHDLLSPEGDEFPDGRELARRDGARTVLAIPLLRDGECIGVIALRRMEVRPFSEKQIELLQTFADQAVIAIGNVRLFDEVQAKTRDLEESLQQQTATSEVLQVISSSPGELEPVFQIMLENATRICGANFGTMYRYDGAFHLMASHNAPPALVEARMRTPVHLPPADTGLGRLERTKQVVHIHDITTESGYATDHAYVAGSKLSGARTVLIVPMLKDAELVGSINIFRQEVRPFTDKQIELLSNFAKQAVIAIENARLLKELRQRTDDLSESLQQQTATSEVLQIISSSPGDLAPVFDKMLENATRVCGAEFGSMVLVEDDSVRQVALYNAPPAFAAARTNKVFRPHPLGQMAAAIRTRQAVQVADVRTTPAYLERLPYSIELAELGGARTVVVVPMLREDEVIGAITIYRQEVRPFADKQIELVSNFAKQAVIAIENTRLLTETREALERQTATAEILQVINSSPGNLAPVFEAILEKAHGLCAVSDGSLQLYDGSRFQAVAVHGLSKAFEERLRQGYVPSPNHPSQRLLQGERFAHVPDIGEIDDPISRVAFELSGIRTGLFIPLRKDGSLVGQIIAARREVRTFSEKEIGLLENFAAQAVIAMENARLLDELRRSLQQQTATADVLKVISRSSVDLETVLDTLVETVARLCRADLSTMYRRRDERDDKYHLVASRGFSEEAKEFFRTHPAVRGRGTLSGRVELERRAVHIPDVLEDPEYTFREGQKIVGFRTLLGIPLLREDSLIGLFAISRTRVEPFTDKEIELASTFADQAMIAIENARLFDELRDRQAELRVTFDNMGDGVVMFDAAGRLTAWNRNFQELIELPESFLAGRPTRAEYFRYLADRGEFVSADLEAQLGRTVDDAGLEMRFERTRPDGRIIEVRRNPVPGGGYVLIYSDITKRKRAEEAIHAARDAAETALRELQKTQASLVHAQKMAALGQLTAGIAHEIKNPLNFVNNFAGLSVELLEELKGATGEAIGTLDAGKRTEILETIGMLTGNLERIAEHGRRADGIVRGMLQHSRGSSGDWQATDLNALVEESLNLAYHGARAQDRDFKVTWELDLDRKLAPIEIVSQDVSRMLLNLISNGFYAVTERGREGDGAYRPVLRITTRESAEGIEIRVRDNGVGIPLEYREKLFQPFFTTKPTGEGTGLGLSISYEIVTQQHGGTITVDSEVGDFTEFTVRLPRRRHGVARETA
jgi:PAS domain S-box-containing protein